MSVICSPLYSVDCGAFGLGRPLKLLTVYWDRCQVILLQTLDSMKEGGCSFVAWTSGLFLYVLEFAALIVPVSQNKI